MAQMGTDDGKGRPAMGRGPELLGEVGPAYLAGVWRGVLLLVICQALAIGGMIAGEAVLAFVPRWIPMGSLSGFSLVYTMVLGLVQMAVVSVFVTGMWWVTRPLPIPARPVGGRLALRVLVLLRAGIVALRVLSAIVFMGIGWLWLGSGAVPGASVWRPVNYGLGLAVGAVYLVEEVVGWGYLAGLMRRVPAPRLAVQGWVLAILSAFFGVWQFLFMAAYWWTYSRAGAMGWEQLGGLLRYLQYARFGMAGVGVLLGTWAIVVLAVFLARLGRLRREAGMGAFPVGIRPDEGAATEVAG